MAGKGDKPDLTKLRAAIEDAQLERERALLEREQAAEAKRAADRDEARARNAFNNADAAVRRARIEYDKALGLEANQP